MTADARRSRGPARRGTPGGAQSGSRGGPEARRGRPRVAGQRAAERAAQQQATEQRREASAKATRRGLALPSLPRFRRGPKEAPPEQRPRPSAQDSSRPSAPRVVTAVLAVLVLLAAAAVGYLAVQLRDARASESAASTGQLTAARYAEQLLSYNHARLDRDFAEAQKLLTERFRKEYTAATDVVREKAVADKAVIKAEVVASSVVNAEPHEVKTLLFVNQTTTTQAKGSTPAIDLNRVMLTLVEEDGRWLVSDLDAL